MRHARPTYRRTVLHRHQLDLGLLNLPPLWEPPARVIFNLSVVRELVITNDENGVRLFVRVTAPPTEDIMVFGQEPCSAGRSKRRNVSFLGLLRPAVDGLSEITDLYKAKFGEPRPGRKVFIVTCQEKNGWKGFEVETSEIVPGNPAGQQEEVRPVGNQLSEGAETALLGAANSSQTENSQKPLMYKGCTRGVQGSSAGVEPGSKGVVRQESRVGTPRKRSWTGMAGAVAVAAPPVREAVSGQNGG